MTRHHVLGPRGRSALTCIVLLLASATGVASAAPAPARPGAVAQPAAPATSTRHSPGWYPNVDPESSAVLLGRRVNAPLVDMPFDGGTRSLDDLGRTICRLLHHGDRDSLWALCIHDTEFRTILWREFPQSRPATGLTWEDGYRTLDMRLRSGIADALSEYGGRPWEFVRIERTDTTAVYRNFRLHHGIVLVVKDDTGAIERWTWVKSLAERRGRFKLYSLKD